MALCAVMKDYCSFPYLLGSMSYGVIYSLIRTDLFKKMTETIYCDYDIMMYQVTRFVQHANKPFKAWFKK